MNERCFAQCSSGVHAVTTANQDRNCYTVYSPDVSLGVSLIEFMGTHFHRGCRESELVEEHVCPGPVRALRFLDGGSVKRPRAQDLTRIVSLMKYQ